jgi:nitrite reductase/ring-hydroxylating ferredoxin subunit
MEPFERASAPPSVPPDRGPALKQPRWRRDFPVDWSEDDYVSRRDLVKFIVLTSAAFAVGQLWIAYKSLRGPREASAERLRIAGVSELPVGGAKTFEYPAESPPRLLVRTGQEKFVAYEQLCTHLQCPIVPAVREGKLHCPCHNGWFDLATGIPVAGPPQRPLRRVTLDVIDGAVYATGVEGGGT